MAELSVTKRYDGVSADRIWDRIGDPGSLADWHPGVEATTLLEGGRTRVNTIPGGGRIVEPIVDVGDHHYTFRITDGPLPLDGFVSTLQVHDDGDGACTVEWQAAFEPKGVTEPEATELVRGFFEAGLEAL